jgi:hypothetical protein
LSASYGAPSGWTWGRLHTATFQEQSIGLSGIGPLEWYFNDGPHAVPGAAGAVNNSYYRFRRAYPDPLDPEYNPVGVDRVFEVTNMPSMRFVIDMTDLDGARIVITGRVTDTGLTLGPLVHEFGWARNAWDLMAAGTVAGHIIECGAQSSGGNLLKDWKRVRGLENPGFPIVEALPDGSFVVTKHPDTGGVVSIASVTEQLVYEMGDPRTYITPDGTADFTTIRLRQAGRDRVHVSGIRGGPRTPMLKVSIAYSYGWKAVGTLVYSWPDAWQKARRANAILRARLEQLGLHYEQILTEYVGADATHGRLAGPPDPDAPEVQLRVGVRARDRAPVERFTREIAPLVLTGPPSVTGFAGGRPAVEEIVAYWPALVDRREIEPQVKVEILEA